MSFRVSRAAAADLLEIFLYGVRQFGAERASSYADGLESAFVLLSEFPRSSPERVGAVSPQRIHPFGAHMIFYTIEPDGGILILRVRHGREDWQGDF